MSQRTKARRGHGSGATRNTQPGTPRGGPRLEGEVEALLRSTLDALSAHVAVLDGSGTIIAVNEAWRAFARAAGFADETCGVGMNYLAVCDRSASESNTAAKTAQALRDIIAGTATAYRAEYPCEGPDGVRWFQVRATRPTSSRTTRIVVAHEDITEVKRAQEALARLSSRLMQVQDEERRAIARELHDTTAQNLLAIALNATRIRESLDEAEGCAREVLSEIVGLTEQSLKEVRTLSYLLHPPLLDDIGLASALRWLAKGFSERSGIDVEVRMAEDEMTTLPREVGTALFRVAQEALSNVHRHSQSLWARISLQGDEQAVRLDVIDRGRGLRRKMTAVDGGAAVGVGIAGMRVRLDQLGGRLTIESSSSGTRVSATVPVPVAGTPGTEVGAPPPQGDQAAGLREDGRVGTRDGAHTSRG